MAATADAANVSQEGKLNITGIFDTIWATDFPVTHPVIVFTFRLRLEHEDGRKTHRLEVNLLDEDFNVLWGGSADLTVPAIPPGQFTHINQVVQLTGVKFAKAGRHRFRIKIRGYEHPYDTVFQVIRAPQQQRR